MVGGAMATIANRRLSWWGWGWEDEALAGAEQEGVARTLAPLLGVEVPQLREPAGLETIELRAPRVAPPAALAALSSDIRRDRISHAYGRSFRDVARAFEGRIDHPPDLVLRPRREDDVAAVLEWCSAERIAVVPFGGGTSVVGGIEARTGDDYRGVVSLDMRELGRVLEVDRTSRAARIEAGVLGPALEDQLRPHGLTMRHYPQSFQFSTLGGWLATRSGGHYATVRTHIDDFVESVRMVTPRGVLETRRLPGSGAGPSPDRMILGSEGILGVITQAWMRLQDPPVHRAQTALHFPSFEQGVEATRVLAQSGLNPANCRLLDPVEAIVSGAGDGSAALLLVTFESHDHPGDALLARAVEIGRDHGGVPNPPREGGRDAAATQSWRGAFLRAPYLRDALVAMGMVSDTFETAITWDRFAQFHAAVSSAVRDAVARVCGAGVVSCRFTHVYPDGPAPYYTVIAASRPGAQVEQWDEIKRAAADAVIDGGGTITHHHAVGRDHRPWYDRQRPALFADALRAAKQALDPAGVLNPGVLLDP
jgi:alkyldihydroxyacetonephosphate synthase